MRRLLFAGLTALASTSVGAQSRVHSIRGRVTTDSAAAIAGADVIVTIAPSAEIISVRSDASGAFSIALTAAQSTGEYLVYIGALGRRPFRRRVTFAPTDTTVTVNAALPSAVTVVAGMVVQAQHLRPPRSLGTEAGVAVTDGLNRQVDGVVNALPPDLQGNIDALAQLVPGLAVTSAGVSAFGLPSDANLTTLNGMAVGVGAVPRDLATTTTFLTSPWDPSRGGFSGALASANVNRGGNVATRRLRATVDQPWLQASDPLASRFGGRYSNIQLGEVVAGPIALDKYFYNLGVQVSHQDAAVSSFRDFDDRALALAGISADSARRLMQILNARNIPLTAASAATRRTSTSAQLLGRFDRAVPNASGDVRPAPLWSLLVGGDYLSNAATNLGPAVLPSTTGRTTSDGAFVQGLYSAYLGKGGDYINETSVAVSFREANGSPYLALPTGSVLVTAPSTNGTAAVEGLSFGGNSVLDRRNRTWAWELNNQTDFLVGGRSLFPAKLFLQSRYEAFEQSVSANRLGVFSYPSLDALANNTPSQFSRAVDVPERNGGQWIGAAALGGSWSSTHWTIAGGARADANVFTATPPRNTAMESTFGVRNDIAPNSVAISPRLGFYYYPTAQRFPIVLFGPNAATNTVRGGFQVRGGIGEFRGTLPSTTLSGAMGTTGLSDGAKQLICTGAATPLPDWQAYLSDPSRVPTACLDGATTLVDTAPPVALVDRRFTPTRSWRATLGWTNTFKNNYIAVDGVYSLNLSQPSVVDLNFAGVRAFTLADEGERPVYVRPTNIDAASGAVSAVDARRSPLFGRVTERVSDLRGDVRQVTVYAVPNIPLRAGLVTVGYTFADARAQQRGFDGSSSIDPRSVEWASLPLTPRHQFVLQSARLLFGGRTALTLSGRLMSGLRYSPSVAADVNGDGVGNDRAFVFDPSRVGDPSLASGVRSLLSSGSASARSCLRAQLNSIAGRNSCVGDWTATMNASVFVGNVPRSGGRVQASLNFANLLGGIDQLLHGDALRGWGSAPMTDAVLYQVRGFDPSARRFIYQVNPHFGRGDPTSSALRAPFRVTLDARFDYSRSPQVQSLELNLRVRPSLRGTRAPADTLKARFMNAGGTDVYKALLRFADSIALSRTQMETMQERQRVLRASVDSIYAPLARYLAALPAGYDARDALRHTAAADDATWHLIYAEGDVLKSLLTPGQIRRIPYIAIRTMLTTRNYSSRFFLGF